MSRPARILLLEMAGDGTVGGSHHCLLNIALAVRNRGFCPVAGLTEESAFLGELERAGIESHVLPAAEYMPARREGLPVPRSTLARGWRFLSARALSAARIRRVLLQWKIDVLHQNNSVGMGEEWILAARAARLPVIVHQRGFFFGNRVNRWTTDRRIHRVICISGAVQRELLDATRVPPSRILKIWDFVDTELFSPLPPADRAAARVAIGEAEDRFLIGMIGNIKEWKGQHVVLQALGRLPPETRRRVRCVFFGAVSNRPEDRAYFDRLTGIVQDASLGAIVAFGGSRSDMSRVYPALDVLVHASIEPEPFGMVLAEAMSCGVPVIASRGGGPEEIVVDGETGWLVDRGDAVGLAARLASLIERPHVLAPIGMNARDRVVRHFSGVEATEQLVALYESVLGRP